jgi:hypothetical protein
MPGALGIGAPPPEVLANTESRRVVSACPDGQVAGASASAIARRSSNVAPQARHRNS